MKAKDIKKLELMSNPPTHHTCLECGVRYTVEHMPVHIWHKHPYLGGLVEYRVKHKLSKYQLPPKRTAKRPSR